MQFLCQKFRLRRPKGTTHLESVKFSCASESHSRLGRDTNLYRVMLDLIITSILPSCSPAAQKSRGSWSLALRRIAHAFRFSVELILKLSFFTNLKKFKVRASIRCRIFYFLFLKLLKRYRK